MGYHQQSREDPTIRYYLLRVIGTLILLLVAGAHSADAMASTASDALAHFFEQYDAGEPVDYWAVINNNHEELLDALEKYGEHAEGQKAVMTVSFAYDLYRKSNDEKIKSRAVKLMIYLAVNKQGSGRGMAFRVLSKVESKWLAEDKWNDLRVLFLKAEQPSPDFILLMGKLANSEHKDVQVKLAELAKWSKPVQKVVDQGLPQPWRDDPPQSTLIEYSSRAWAANLALARQGDDAALRTVLERLDKEEDLDTRAYRHPEFLIYVRQEAAILELLRMLYLDERLAGMDGRPGRGLILGAKAYRILKDHITSLPPGFDPNPKDEDQFKMYLLLRRWILQQDTVSLRFDDKIVTVKTADIKTKTGD